MLRKVFYVYEPNRSGVIIGPAALNQKSDTLELLEHGGTRRLTNRERGLLAAARKRALDNKSKGKRNQANRQYWKKVRAHITGTAKYRARPFMGPSGAEGREKLDGWLKDSVEGQGVSVGPVMGPAAPSANVSLMGP